MKVVRIETLPGEGREVKCPNGGFTSLRALLASDGMGFSMHKTIVPKGPPQHWHYMNHIEACYCIAGRGTLTNLMDGTRYNIEPDTIYVLDDHDDHTFEAHEDTILISVFNPPVTGNEVHDENGSYQLPKKNTHGNDLWEH